MIAAKINGQLQLSLTQEEAAILTSALCDHITNGIPILSMLLSMAVTQAPQEELQQMLNTLCEKTKNVNPLVRTEADMILTLKKIVETR